MTWKIGIFNVLCSLIAALIIKFFEVNAKNTDMGFLGIFFDFKLNYVIFFAVVNILFVTVVTSMQKRKYTSEILDNRNALFILRDIGRSSSDTETVLFSYGKYGYSTVPSNEKWADWISYEKGGKGLVKTVDRPDLDYNDFGNEFCFFDLVSGKNIPIPTGNSAKHDIVGNSFRNGMVLRLIAKDLQLLT